MADADNIADSTGGRLHLRMIRGNSFTRTLRFTDRATGAPLTLPTATWRAQVRRTAESATPLAEFSVDGSQAANGVVVLNMTDQQAELLAVQCATAVWSLQVDDGTPLGRITWLMGSVMVIEDPTRV